MASLREKNREKAQKAVFELLEATAKASDLKRRISEGENGSALAERKDTLQKIESSKLVLSALGYELFIELIRSDYPWMED